MRVKNFRKMLLEWKNGFLLEDSGVPLAEGSRISFEEVNALFHLFHLSNNVLGDADDQFKFMPRIPASPFMDDSGNFIEDDFTKRISLGPTIEKCQEALDFTNRANFLYAGDIRNYSKDDIEVVPLKVFFRGCEEMLNSPGNEYGHDFNFDQWSEDYIDKYHDELTKRDAEQIAGAARPSELPPEEEHMFYACVPDALKTNEMWSKEPLNLYFLGTVTGRETVRTVSPANLIRLSEGGAKVVTIARKYQRTIK